MEILIYILAAFFALNMGSPSFAGSFSTAAGSGSLSKRAAQIFFLIFAAPGEKKGNEKKKRQAGRGHFFKQTHLI